ncbi:MAG: hypothetical protein JO345_33210 [Streptosporangiaceae bacterium]|nr:hypothetical protein [Streptosporangiaceae bacterium]
MPVQTTPECSGLWIALPGADYIFYEQDTTKLHQLHIIGHETGHMVFGHHQVPVSDSEFACLLFPDLSQELIRSMLARSGYTDAEEEEAEAFASLLMERITLDLHAPASPEAEARMCRVESAFGPGRRWN